MSEENKGDRKIDSRPMCKYGAECYRKNPAHFEEYRHPGISLRLNSNRSSKKHMHASG